MATTKITAIKRRRKENNKKNKKTKQNKTKTLSNGAKSMQ